MTDWKTMSDALAEALRVLLAADALSEPLSAEDAAKVLIASAALAQYAGQEGGE